MKTSKKDRALERRQLKSDIAIVLEILALLAPERDHGLGAKIKLSQIKDRWGERHGARA